MRILYLLTFPLYGSGSGTYARYLALQLSKKNNVAILCPDIRRLTNVKIYDLKLPFQAAFSGHPEWKKIKLFSKLSNTEILTLHKALLDSCVQAVEDFKPDIIHVHHAFPISWSARFIKSTYGIPYLITVHGSELPTAAKDPRYIALTTDSLRKARKIVPNSYYTREWMLSIFKNGYDRQIKVIPGGVDVSKFVKVPTDKIDKEYNLKDKRVIMFAGKLTAYKGVEYLVRAAENIAGEVVILGDGTERLKLEGIVKERKLKNVRFIGHLGNKISKLIQFYSRADVLVVPSIWDEPLGLVILESMACETPVIVTRKGGMSIAVKEGKNGLFIRPRSSEDIAKKVNELLSDDKKLQKMGKQARAMVIERFSWEIIGKEFESMYREFANK